MHGNEYVEALVDSGMVAMDMTRMGTYYPIAAERFAAVVWGMSTPLSEIMALSTTITVVRVRDDGALVISVSGDQRVVTDGSVVRLNRTTGAVAVMTKDEFENAFRPAQ
jgi:hypothetical protein